MTQAIVYSKEVDKIHRAIFEIQQECPFIGKDSTNPHFKSKYASLEDIWSTLRPLFLKHGLMVSQVPGDIINGNVEVITQLIHVESQQFFLTRGLMPMGKEGPQAAGSAITYARRYFLCPMLGIVAGEDDDAEAAEGRDAATLAKLRTRKEDVLKKINSLTGNTPSGLKEFVARVLARTIDDKITLNNVGEIAMLEKEVATLTGKKV
jgi:hypothetical protein